MKAEYFSTDIQEFVILLNKYRVRYVIVGGEAVIYYGYVRVTGDIDIFYDSSPENAEKLYSALKEFWQGEIPGIKYKEEFVGQNIIIQFGRPPNRLDLLSTIDSVAFNEAWDSKKTEKIVIDNREYHLFYIGLDKLIQNKSKVGRNKDLDDLKYLKAIKA